MPLIIITGLPSSGKTYRAQQIAEYISRRIKDEAPSKRSVHIVGSHHASQDTPLESSESTASHLRDEVYTTSSREKTARAEEFSSIKRGVSKDTVVIADCPNYIKGYRYQLYCEAKAVGTRSCVVHVAALEDDCTRWNEERLSAWHRANEIETDANQTGQDITVHGKDVLGHLKPESHTGVYGDRVVEQSARSRSSSTHGIADTPTRQQDDTMTLKSLYISGTPSPLNTRKNNGKDSNTDAAAAPTTIQPATPVPPPTDSPPYSPSTLSSLLMRYEPPSPFSRWDTPLFTLPTTDVHPPYSQIWDALFPPTAKPTSKKALSQLPSRSTTTQPNTNPASDSIDPDSSRNVRPHAATVLPTATASSALQTLEGTTLLVVRALLAAAREQSAADGDGGMVTFSVELPTSISNPTTSSSTPGAADIQVEEEKEKEKDGDGDVHEIAIPPGTVLSQPLLQRLRRQFTQVQRGRIAHGQGYVGQSGGIAGRKEAVGGFVRFLEGELGGVED